MPTRQRRPRAEPGTEDAPGRSSRPVSQDLEAGAHPAGIGPAGGTTFTVYFPEGEALESADLEHAAALPSVGDVVEFIDESLSCRRYRVREVIHTLQVAPLQRHAAHGWPAGSRSVDPSEGQPELRAGLPKVFLEPEPGS